MTMGSRPVASPVLVWVSATAWRPIKVRSKMARKRSETRIAEWCCFVFMVPLIHACPHVWLELDDQHTEGERTPRHPVTPPAAMSVDCVRAGLRAHECLELPLCADRAMGPVRQQQSG